MFGEARSGSGGVASASAKSSGRSVGRRFALGVRSFRKQKIEGKFVYEYGYAFYLTTIERQGRREKEQPKVGPKGEGVGTTESNDAEGTTKHRGRCAVDCRKAA